MNKAEAERQIAAILKRLEEETGEVVESLYLNSTVVSKHGEPDQRRCSVEIELHRLPGNDWAA